jgi:predicted Rossmann fold nucleotide-binding protein DprA/Smf involved in DNA uptake
LLQSPSIAIVGSRNADTKSLSFTDNIAKKAAEEKKVVVSGFAKGVDRQALDSTLIAKGKSIIVLPQGIMTFGSGFKQYFKHIAQGKVLVISSFAPKAPWSVEFAMSRNPIIYGMASEIFVAQSDDKGGTWAGVIDGLRKNRPIYVRYPEKNEKNANLLLIQKGASAVDALGNTLSLNPEEQKTPEQLKKEKLDSDLIAVLNSVEKITAKEIISRLHLEWKDDKMKRYLDKMQQVEKIKIKIRIYYRLKGKSEQGLFDDQMYV